VGHLREQINKALFVSQLYYNLRGSFWRAFYTFIMTALGFLSTISHYNSYKTLQHAFTLLVFFPYLPVSILKQSFTLRQNQQDLPICHKPFHESQQFRM
jgi:hypothetical protein